MKKELDEIVGHKTVSNGRGGYRHEPLSRGEADDIWRQCEAADARRKELMPDEEAARRMFFEAWRRLKDFEWLDAIHCPKDGSTFEVIEAGSAGIHKCTYDGEWPTGCWWVCEDGDMWPSRPVLFRFLSSGANDRIDK